MPSLTIRHVTTYRYRQSVAFGEHRMMLRPRDSHDQRVIEASLEHSPLDAADLDLEDAARTFPVVYSANEMPNAINPIRGTRLAAGLINSCPQWVDRHLELLMSTPQ
jgi:hypothetical protein